jgi:hypothetical protein
MSAIDELVVGAGPREVHDFLRKGMDHVELVSEDVFGSGEDYTAVMLYQQYFMRAGNRAALMLIVAGRGDETRVKAVATGSSRDLILDWDLGAAHDFVQEPLNLLRDKYRKSPAP